ncbi:putative short-subunit dehydrogenase-like oxidoreductase (DUF2520 family) [Pedobacter sp. CG_S7]|uniref:Rossmann-like and DUF2520 domain-containing protein n=1 Tax=Pedobacter sp. CG_S7 TaxID=3143930 RepID=UPI0033987604
MKIVCLGSGNVATNLASAFKTSGAEIVQIWSKTLANAQALASVLKSQAIDNLNEIDKDADLYLICIKDDAIIEVASKLTELKGLVLHTSGATGMDVFSNLSLTNYGVIYPLQTFSKNRKIDPSTIPLCIEADSEETLTKLRSIAAKLGPLIYQVNSVDRKILHLAAVFACNFTNHLYQISADILERNHLDFDMLKPLITETAAKVQSALPKEVQTGPAIRNDELTMRKHLQLLKSTPELVNIYETLSKSIKKTYL